MDKQNKLILVINNLHVNKNYDEKHRKLNTRNMDPKPKNTLE